MGEDLYRVSWNQDLDANSKLTLLAIAFFAEDDTGEATDLSIQRLCDLTRLDEEQLGYALDELKKRELVAISFRVEKQ